MPFFHVSRAVRHRLDPNVLEHDHRCAALDDTEEDVVRFGPLKRDVEAESVAIKLQRGGDIAHNEEWRNAGNLWFTHVRPFTETAGVSGPGPIQAVLFYEFLLREFVPIPVVFHFHIGQELNKFRRLTDAVQ